MRWFKHFTDNHRGQSIQSLMDELGYFGPFFYYLIYELCAEKLEQELRTELTPEHCQFVFHQRVVCSASRAKPFTIGRALDAGQSCGLWSWELDGSYIKISMPILLNLLDRDMKKPRLKREKSAPNTRLDKNRVEKSRTEQSRNIPASKITSLDSEKNLTPLPTSVAWNSYREAILDRWKEEPTRNAKVNSCIKQIVSRVGEDAADVLKFYVKHNDSQYVRTCHSVGLALRDIESLHMQWKKNIQITQTKMREFEKKSQYQEMMDLIDEQAKASGGDS